MATAVARKDQVRQPAPSATATVVSPRSATEIAEIMQDRTRYPSPLRPVGSGSSATRCISAGGGTVMDLSGMDRVLRTGDDTVTVQPGITLSELADILSEQQLELIGGFDLANRTAGGAVCSATLEPSMQGDAGQFAAHATQIKLVTPQGKRFVANESNRNLLALMRLSYGLLGVVYEITLRVRPVQGFAVHSARSSFRDFAKLGSRLTDATSGLKMYLLPFRDRVYFELRRPAAEGVAGRRFAWRLRDWTVNAALPDVVRSISRAVPLHGLRYPLIDSMGLLAQRVLSSQILRNGSHALEQSGRIRMLGGRSRLQYSTWGFPAADFGNIALAYKLMCQEHYTRTGFRCDMPSVAFRLNEDRSALLSPSFDGPLVTLTAISTSRDSWDDFALEFAEFAIRHGAVALFNQTAHANPGQITQALGQRLQFFTRIRRELDPQDRLLNPFFATTMR